LCLTNGFQIVKNNFYIYTPAL